LEDFIAAARERDALRAEVELLQMAARKVVATRHDSDLGTADLDEAIDELAATIGVERPGIVADLAAVTAERDRLKAVLGGLLTEIEHLLESDDGATAFSILAEELISEARKLLAPTPATPSEDKP
jgi:hypothetical protein